jgi:hypothetical protein
MYPYKASIKRKQNTLNSYFPKKGKLTDVTNTFAVSNNVTAIDVSSSKPAATAVSDNTIRFAASDTIATSVNDVSASTAVAIAATIEVPASTSAIDVSVSTPTAIAASNTNYRFANDSVGPSLDDVLRAIEEEKNLQGDSWQRADLDSFDHKNTSCPELIEWKEHTKNFTISEVTKWHFTRMLWFLFEIIRLHPDPVFRSLADKIHCRLTNETTRRFFTLCRKSSPGEQSKKDALVKQVFEMFLWNIYKKGMCSIKVAVDYTKSYFNKQHVKIKNGEFDLPEENELLKCGKKWCWTCIQIKEIETEFNELGTNKTCNACLSRNRNWKKKNQEATNDGEKRCGRCSRPKSIEKEFIDEQEIERDNCHSCRANSVNWNKTNRTENRLGKKEKYEDQGTVFVRDISLSLISSL